ncbi:MAG: hypothetical protein QOK43_1341 [Acidimicrobiaceae bacterium]|nr:hypothetical protein [Acidimicrobiaceae bacterium]
MQLVGAAPGAAGGQLFERAHQVITALIRRLELAPGETFAEGDLAERLALSKTPVRESLLVLRQMGLVDARAGSGYTVRPLGDVVGLWRFAAILERASASRAIAEASIAGLDPRIRGFVATDPRVAMILGLILGPASMPPWASEASIDHYVAKLLAIHRVIVGCSADPYILRASMHLQVDMERSIRMALAASQAKGIEPPNPDDTALAMAILGRDTDTADALLVTRSVIAAWVFEALELAGDPPSFAA